MKTQEEILSELISKWISLGVEYAKGAPDIRAVFVYASAEGGSYFANVYFDQGGKIVFPGDLSDANVSVERQRQVQRILRDDLFAAEDEFRDAGIPAPTEYRVYYEPGTGKLDTSLSREPIYSGDPDKLPERGIEYWLGDRAPKLV